MQFSSLEHEGEYYMTPRDFLFSVMFEQVEREWLFFFVNLNMSIEKPVFKISDSFFAFELSPFCVLCILLLWYDSCKLSYVSILEVVVFTGFLMKKGVFKMPLKRLFNNFTGYY